MAQTARVHIGASGWHYKHWKGPFYPKDLPASRMLAWYYERFDTVEINNSFYRLPSLETFRAWHDSTPENFLFAVKASRFITHMKKLTDPEQSLDRLFASLAGLGKKLGPVLFQLPPFLDLKLDRLREFLAALPRSGRFAFEFRNPAWHIPEVYDLLKTRGAAFCVYDLAGFQSPVVTTADFVYIRLHGPGGAYQGSYSEKALKVWVERLQDWRVKYDIHVYFDNDQQGFAVRNAGELKALVTKVTFGED